MLPLAVATVLAAGTSRQTAGCCVSYGVGSGGAECCHKFEATEATACVAGGLLGGGKRFHELTCDAAQALPEYALTCVNPCAAAKCANGPCVNKAVQCIKAPCCAVAECSAAPMAVVPTTTTPAAGCCVSYGVGSGGAECCHKFEATEATACVAGGLLGGGKRFHELTCDAARALAQYANDCVDPCAKQVCPLLHVCQAASVQCIRAPCCPIASCKPKLQVPAGNATASMVFKAAVCGSPADCAAHASRIRAALSRRAPAVSISATCQPCVARQTPSYSPSIGIVGAADAVAKLAADTTAIAADASLSSVTAAAPVAADAASATACCLDVAANGTVTAISDAGGCAAVANPVALGADACASASSIPTLAPSVCVLAADAGPCKAAIPMWTWDLATSACVPFTYGGCGGNLNRFDSQAACQAACPPRGAYSAVGSGQSKPVLWPIALVGGVAVLALVGAFAFVAVRARRRATNLRAASSGARTLLEMPAGPMDAEGMSAAYSPYARDPELAAKPLPHL